MSEQDEEMSGGGVPNAHLASEGNLLPTHTGNGAPLTGIPIGKIVRAVDGPAAGPIRVRNASVRASEYVDPYPGGSSAASNAAPPASTRVGRSPGPAALRPLQNVESLTEENRMSRRPRISGAFEAGEGNGGVEHVEHETETLALRGEIRS